MLTRWRAAFTRFFIGRLQSGNLLFVKHLGIDEDPLSGGKLKQRRELTAFISKDDGYIWSKGLVVDERVGCSYPDVQQAADGTLFMIWDFMLTRWRAAFTRASAASSAASTSSSRNVVITIF